MILVLVTRFWSAAIDLEQVRVRFGLRSSVNVKPLVTDEGFLVVTPTGLEPVSKP